MDRTKEMCKSLVHKYSYPALFYIHLYLIYIVIWLWNTSYGNELFRYSLHRTDWFGGIFYLKYSNGKWLLKCKTIVFFVCLFGFVDILLNFKTSYFFFSLVCFCLFFAFVVLFLYLFDFTVTIKKLVENFLKTCYLHYACAFFLAFMKT